MKCQVSIPAKCLSDVPLAPNFVTSFPLDWKMNTQQALLSAVMMCPFLSTATPLGPISRPAPILFCGVHESLKNSTFSFQKLPENGVHLKLAVGGENANPSVVIVGHDDVAIHVHRDPGGTLQLPRWTTSNPKPHFKLAVIRKYLRQRGDWSETPKWWRPKLFLNT